MREPTLNGTKGAAPPPRADTCHPTKKFSSLFPMCARRIFSSPPATLCVAMRAGKRKRKLFCGTLLLTSRAAGRSLSDLWRTSARVRRNSPHTPLPPRPRLGGQDFWRRLFLFLQSLQISLRSLGFRNNRNIHLLCEQDFFLHSGRYSITKQP